jgi:hypothetical protein
METEQVMNVNCNSPIVIEWQPQEFGLQILHLCIVQSPNAFHHFHIFRCVRFETVKIDIFGEFWVEFIQPFTC